jgi:hypothetical protein
MGEDIPHHRANLWFEGEFLAGEKLLERSEMGFEAGV